MELSQEDIESLQRYCDQLCAAFGVDILLSDKQQRDIVVSKGATLDEAQQSATYKMESYWQGELIISGRPQAIEDFASLLHSKIQDQISKIGDKTRIERYESFLDIAADWFWETDREHRFTYLSGKLEEILGLRPDEILGQTRKELYGGSHDTNNDYWQAHLSALDAHRPFYAFEVMWLRPDTGVRYLRLNGSPFFSEEGEFLGYRGTGQDITDHRRAELNFKNLVEGSIQGIYIHTNQQILFANEAMARMFGYRTANEFLRHNNVDSLLLPQEVERVHGLWANHADEYEADYRKKDGTVLTLHSLNREIEWNGQAAIQSVVIDITQKRKAEEKLQRHHVQLQELVDERTAELKKSEERFRKIAESASDWFWETDKDHRFTFLSDRFLDVTGIDSGKVIGKSRIQFAEEQVRLNEDGEKWKKHREDLENHRPFEIRYWVSAPTQGDTCLEIKGKPIFNGDGEFEGYLGAGANVTDKVKAQETLQKAKDMAEKANQAKSDFLSSMSHELRTPLNAILGFTQLLEGNVEGNLMDVQLKHLHHIRKGGEHLLQLINEILDLAKIEAGKLTFSMEKISPRSLIEDCLPYAKAFASKYDVTIVDRSEGDLPLVRVDALRVKQALLNLLSNASKYNRAEGMVWIDVSYPRDTLIRISVRDTGMGIAKEDQRLLFQPFQRLGGTDNKVEGTGIGLVFTKKLIEEMGGTVGFESEYKKGSTFWIDLPLVSRQPSPVSILPTAQPVEGMPVCAPAGKHTLLYVEDNPSNLSLMESIVDCIPSLDMISAHTAEIGLSLAEENIPDLILLDINLPGMSGSEALQHLKKNEKTRHVPVLAISADAMPASIKGGMEAGFDRYLTKPIDIPNLMQVLDEFLD
ncbi:PAS domain-containing hybrid sensor histidine kinase/response regulator [Terasakiella sp. SH-1]|uniref:PAS domain-containing hybrid sensor histidine kinase/response regulator n=1 Tax=Terasakiella sp. SH-1 TaxID=2560057 RepID=UPI0010747A2B|nr:PAS domain-containing hybrid sensor histidine kinase/response regulator [Terasakiella sp. SH-1]